MEAHVSVLQRSLTPLHRITSGGVSSGDQCSTELCLCKGLIVPRVLHRQIAVFAMLLLAMLLLAMTLQTCRWPFAWQVECFRAVHCLGLTHPLGL